MSSTAKHKRDCKITGNHFKEPFGIFNLESLAQHVFELHGLIHKLALNVTPRQVVVV